MRFLVSSIISAATENTLNVLSRTLHLLVTHLEVQDNLRREIADALCNDEGRDLSYDELVSPPSWMQSAERRFACGFIFLLSIQSFRNSNLNAQKLPTFRTDTSDVRNPFLPIRVDGRQMDEIIIPKGTTIVVSIINCTGDPALWGPDSREWKPERWLSPLPDTATKASSPRTM
jgi:hypothetical protein